MEFIMTIRKNFLLDDEIAEHLEKIAKKDNITQTQVIRNMIEEKYEKYSIEEKLEALERIIKSAKKLGPNKFLEQFDKNDNKILQKVKGMIE